MPKFTQLKQSPFRYDHVGSFLRPQELIDARAKFENGEIEYSELKTIEDQAIIDLIKKEEAVGLKTITDGEFRRKSWHFDFFWGLNGVDRVEVEAGTQFSGEQVFAVTSRIVDKITGDKHPFVDHFKFTQSHASDHVDVKQTIPAPAQFLQEVLRDFNKEYTQGIYSQLDDLLADITQAYSQVIEDLYQAGCRTVQFDDCTWGRLAGGKDYDGSEYSQRKIEELKALYARVNNAVIANKPSDLRINTHVCRGNFRSTWFASGGYDTVQSPLFDQENVHAYFLEYDSERAGTFEPLKTVSDDKHVVLGLVTTKSAELESQDDLIARIKEASQYVPLDRLSISPQCGFSSNKIGNKISEEDQWKKIKLLIEVAKEVWGEDA
ncbi:MULTISPECIES: 5-methyltetrahydropteroyltriglutamate--homocysteine S-methyltransferase [Aerococcus]|uniref:5-methyltetrahydropteroyltriglutamate-- homocysteine S-methyltransferase n=1 Tax=Aerococcus urinae (strain CCUG 59500 / ACS-120-V-Col10a) TaxID=2976812 RepID=UPI00227B3FF8|nr:5-methyltetrahydropteroyltriglutamate--homocysteine S-methyltransferase [Aerococcus sp. Group 1]MCY3030483.1 5-methyltetrahydropteroyltriglutamate--homocysteine S-methyltransferase [Aerococcus sp. Group 1]MCY3054526.1 5-methyltetrahydropteroyltriglutamate--homocysteine S-methyltransferase [Aerococcus sp. Group 1]MCY3056256.1 5-methyltetrahydropteroyltriglutamate--homocysteine S-methyltransferase [Aerococcus sp. Group 1]MCY3061714.1 5-methyltetrahydropteroyltriglutamate--homocysteine S-methyl